MDRLHDSFVWNNSGGMLPVIEGKDAMRAALTKMAGKTRSNSWRLFDYAETGDTLWMEGVDEFTGTDGSHLAVPYAGVLEFRDGQLFVVAAVALQPNDEITLDYDDGA